MSKQKERWRTIGVPTPIFERVKALIARTGHTSVSEYARFAINERMKFDVSQMEDEKECLLK